MAEPVIEVVQRGRVRWLWLNRPERRNALDDQLIEMLRVEALHAEADAGTDVVVVAGRGKAFSAGGDFTHFLRSGGGRAPIEFLRRISDCFSLIEATTKPWIAAIHGHAIAGGLELALVCDVVVAAAGTQVADGHLVHRLLPAGGSSVRLERAIGKGTARWIHLSGEPIEIESLERSGWVRSVVAPDELEEEAQAIAITLTRRSGVSQRRFKELLGRVHNLDPTEGLAEELDAFRDNWSDSNVPESLGQFLDRSRASRAIGGGA